MLESPNTIPNNPNSLGRSFSKVTWEMIEIIEMTVGVKALSAVGPPLLPDMHSQIPAAPTPEIARPTMSVLTSWQLPQMALPISKTVIEARRTYFAG